ncbi:hypothetical protein AND_006826 [Anopheles darlingi]|uniref:Uncharacterized protein n=1 Tax=Anopheles darlingi TaxID=43151 RepID=W5JAN7_ANODA|nr:hypothetical protein AND_006826 [Anopheles darlingi]
MGGGCSEDEEEEKRCECSRRAIQRAASSPRVLPMRNGAFSAVMTVPKEALMFTDSITPRSRRNVCDASKDVKSSRPVPYSRPKTPGHHECQ